MDNLSKILNFAPEHQNLRISMCTVTEEMVLRANDRLAQNMKKGLHRQAVVGGGIVMPVNVFGMTVYGTMSMERVNQIYGEARKKVIASNGKSV